MPQIFQVLKCYKCFIFQVHQTKRDIKWICKVCGEKQSIKRHYGIGTAKDCRIHVQKLNNLQGDKDESKLRTIDSDESDFENEIENICKIVNDGNKVDINCDSAKESKWSAYVEKEAPLNQAEGGDYLEDYLVSPQKQKAKRTNKRPKRVSYENNNFSNTSELNLKHREDNAENSLKDVSYLNKTFCISKITEQVAMVEANESISASAPLGSLENINKASKWSHFIETDENTDFTQHKTHVEINAVDISHKSETFICNEQDLGFNSIQGSTISDKKLFSLCNDSDLDTILDI